MARSRLWVAALAFLPLLGGATVARAAAVREIQAVIDAGGGGWVAGPTPVSDLPPDAKARLAGMIPPSPEDLAAGAWYESRRG